MEDSEKFDELYKILYENKNEKVLVFVETKKQVDLITNDLWDKGLNVYGLHGDKGQTVRDSTLHKFKTEKSILIATDVAQRGLDIKNIAIVIN